MNETKPNYAALAKQYNCDYRTVKRRFSKYDLVILDELGYVSFDQVGSEILFNLLSNRNNSGSMIIITNLGFERWEETFKDPILTAAIVD
ncbi:ATP-binding protein [Carnobacterium maltaromaticum]|uniref:ATP-binding protein n=1 Tax=Carnobacterium maltaromaticum TaxID=2751 RepID=UPI001E420D88|nr:ATP-binding protein [Carnobacterium maltaromaticum]